MNQSSKAAIEDERNGTEIPLWCGQPRQGFIFRADDALWIPMSFVGIIFLLIFEAKGLSSDEPEIVIVGVPVFVACLYKLAGRFFVDARRRARTAYAVTTERILIVSGIWSRKVISLDIATLSDVSLSERKDGSGTIYLGKAPPLQEWYAVIGRPAFSPPPVPTLELADGARTVFELIRKAHRSAAKHA